MGPRTDLKARLPASRDGHCTSLPRSECTSGSVQVRTSSGALLVRFKWTPRVRHVGNGCAFLPSAAPDEVTVVWTSRMGGGG